MRVKIVFFCLFGDGFVMFKYRTWHILGVSISSRFLPLTLTPKKKLKNAYTAYACSYAYVTLLLREKVILRGTNKIKIVKIVKIINELPDCTCGCI